MGKKGIISLLGYLICIAAGLVIMIYINGKVGIIFISLLITAFVFSSLYTLFVRFNMQIDTSQDEHNFFIRFTGKNIFFSPVLHIELTCSAHISPEGGTAQKFVYFRTLNEELEIPISYKHIGPGRINVSKISINDYLGIFSVNLPLSSDCSASFSVYPEIVNISHQTDLLQKISFLSEDDDEEDEASEISYYAAGTPGFEHREYIPGDPIKRINWKLSAKRNTYMVRLDEIAISHGPIFFFDCPACDETDFFLNARDNVIKGILAVLSTLVSDGRKISFYICVSGNWVGTDISSYEDVSKLQDTFANYKPAQPKSIMPDEVSSVRFGAVCFTSAAKGCSHSLEAICSKKPDILVISSKYAELDASNVEHWVVSENIEFSRKNI